MIASALIAFFAGPTLGFAFAVVVGPVWGVIIGMVIAGRGDEVEHGMRSALRFASSLRARARRPLRSVAVARDG